MGLPKPLNWLRQRDSYVVFGFNRSDAIVSDWWSHRTPDHTQIFFDTLREAEDWVKANHFNKGFGRNQEGQAEGE